MHFARAAAPVMLWVAALVHLGSFAYRTVLDVSMKGIVNVDLNMSRSDQGLSVSGMNEYLTAIRSFYARGGSVVPFHNIDHANNIMEFAKWYATQMNFKRGDTKVLILSAISHDVMHPGTRCPQNVRGVVEGNFLADVKNKFQIEFPRTARYKLVRFAAEVWKELQKGGVSKKQMYKAFGHTWVPFNISKGRKAGGFIPKLMVDRAPQEVLHAWVTHIHLDKFHKFLKLNAKSKAKVLINILMTSISLQFKLKYAPQNYERAHVDAMCQDEFFHTFQCGLLLHLLDMGWCTQLQCVKDGFCMTPDPSLFFAPRFLAESGFYKKDTTSDLVTSEHGFVDMVSDLVANIYAGANNPKIMHESMKDTLLGGAEEHKKIVADAKFTDAIADIVGEYNLERADWMVG